MPRIGFDGRALASPAAGVRRYTQELFGALAALGGHEVVAVGVPAGAETPRGVERGPDAASLPTNPGWMLTGLPRAAQRARLDLFHAPAYTAPARGPRPLVVTIHDVSYERHPEWYPYRRDPVRRAFYRWSATTADRIITDSAFSRSEIVAAYGLAAERISVVPLAAAPVFAPGRHGPVPPQVPSRFVLLVGDLHVRRNPALIVRAVAAVRAKQPALRDLAVVFAGMDRGEGQVLRQVAAGAPGDAPVIVFAGAVAEPTLLALYRAAAALVYPSRYEGFGLPVLEAMASGCPVIASNRSAIPEVAGDAAILLDPDDQDAWTAALERVLEDRCERERLREAGLARAAAFSWRATAAATARIYLDLLGVRP